MAGKGHKMGLLNSSLVALIWNAAFFMPVGKMQMKSFGIWAWGRFSRYFKVALIIIMFVYSSAWLNKT